LVDVARLRFQKGSSKHEVQNMKGSTTMQSGTWKFSLLTVLLVAMMVVVGCQSEAEQAAEATVEVKQEKIDDFFALAEAHVVAATEIAGGLPSQEAKAELLVADLEEINNRLSEAVETKAEVRVAALEGVAQLVETVKSDVQEIVENVVDALPEEAQDDLKQLQSELEDLQGKIQDEIDNVKKELGQEVEEAGEAAEEAVEGAEDAAEEAVEGAEDAVEGAEESAEEAVEEAEEEATPTP
jgi:signal transduction histidine kinase